MEVLIPGREGALSRAWRGQLSLPATFWFVFFVPNIFLRAFSLVAFPLVLRITSPLFKSGSQGLGYLGFLMVLACPALVGLVLLGYTIFSFGAVWRSADNYSGSKFWRIAAKTWLILGISVGFLIGGYKVMKIFGAPKMNGQDAERYARAHAIPSKEFPIAGWWADNCTKGPDLAIMPAMGQSGGVKYSIVFCGNGCFSPGTYRPDTTIVGDPHYRVSTNDIIEMDTATGWERIFRCRSNDPTPRSDR